MTEPTTEAGLTGDTAALKLLVGKTPGQGNWLWPVTLADIERAVAEARADRLVYGHAEFMRGWNLGRADALREAAERVRALAADGAVYNYNVAVPLPAVLAILDPETGP